MVARIPRINGLFSVVRAPVEALAALPAAVASLTGAARGLGDVVIEARVTLTAVHRLAVRLDAMATELEQPLRELAPGLARLAVVLDDPAVDDLPDTLRKIQQDALPVLRTLADTHERVAFLAGTSRTVAQLPGAALLGWRRTGARGDGPSGEPTDPG